MGESYSLGQRFLNTVGEILGISPLGWGRDATFHCGLIAGEKGWALL